VAAVDGILQMQAKSDTDYFLSVCGRSFDRSQVERIGATFLAAYRYQYITSGVSDPRFQEILGSMINQAQFERIGAALAPIVN